MAYLVFGALDLRHPYRVVFHDILSYKLSWIPNALYIYGLGLVCYAGLLGLMYHCFGPKKIKEDNKDLKKMLLFKSRSRLGNNLVYGFVSV